ncbi:MAG: septum formation initiator family protein [Patescibacteria group bacterium]
MCKKNFFCVAVFGKICYNVIMGNRGQNKKNVLSKFFLILAVLGIVVIVLGIVREYGKRMAMEKQMKELTAELNRLQGQKSEFLSSVDLYSSEFFVERTARNKFNLKKEGETVIVIKHEDNPSVETKSALATTENISADVVGENLRLWLEYFFGDKNFINKIANKS